MASYFILPIMVTFKFLNYFIILYLSTAGYHTVGRFYDK